jgi:glycosyltransferase involved in cell wall biosynthesis
VAARASAVTAVSRWLCAQAEGMAPGVRCEVAPMPVAADLFAPPTDGASRDGLLFVGRLTQQKGVDALLQAVAAMQVPAAVTIVGSGPEEGALRALAERLGVARRITWLPAQPQTALPALYAAARALVIPSREEGLGLVGVEAHLCGTPVVAFASGGLPDVVHHTRDGLLVPPGDTTALAAALDALTADVGRAARLGAAGRALALATFAPRPAADRYAAIYARALAARA